MTQRNPFQEFDREPDEDHPLHKIVRAHPHIKLLMRNIREATKRLIKAIGSDHSPWIQLEELINKHLHAREEILFNLGFEHGYLSGEGEALQMVSGRDPDDKYRAFAEELRILLVRSSLPELLGIAVLLETAWSMCLKRAKQQRI
ncbi:MAG: hypothetical protein QNJ97_27220 [Myxococcota bacterium]|nr:hypothetical protein [Myxococcota bacterium]